MKQCSAKHTAYQPTNDEWRCPKCGAGVEHFTIYDSSESALDDCELLHKDDYLLCTNCNYESSGAAFSKLIMKQINVVECPCCKGKGVVSPENAESLSPTFKVKREQALSRKWHERGAGQF